MRGSTGALAVFFIGVVLDVSNVGCTRGSPPAPPGIDAAVSPLPGPAAASTALSTTTDGSSGPAPAASSGVAVPAASSAVTAAASASAGDPGALPQTRDKPSAASASLDARAKALWDGIVHDDPERAMPFFFPVTAYEQVKAIPSPASDWRRRLVAAYKRDIHGLAKRLGDKADSAKFVRLAIPEDRARWVEPDEESNKLGYWRVYGTHVVYEIDGKERTLDVSSLISWRGEWYVVHLTGFK